MRPGTLSILPLLALLCMPITAQEKSNRRKEYKEFKAMPIECRCDSVLLALNTRQWIVECDRVPGRRGASIDITPGTWFFAVKGDELIISAGQSHGKATSNNQVKGTLQFTPIPELYKATINQYEVTLNNETKIQTVSIIANNDSGTLHVDIELRPCGEVAWIELTGKKIRKQVAIGHLLPLNFSATYQAYINGKHYSAGM